ARRPDLYDRRTAGGPRPAAGLPGRDRSASHADRVPAARDVGPLRGQGGDAAPAPARGLGAGIRGGDTVFADLYDPSAPQARGRPGPPALPDDRARGGVSATSRLSRPGSTLPRRRHGILTRVGSEELYQHGTNRLRSD